MLLKIFVIIVVLCVLICLLFIERLFIKRARLKFIDEFSNYLTCEINHYFSTFDKNFKLGDDVIKYYMSRYFDKNDLIKYKKVKDKNNDSK